MHLCQIVKTQDSQRAMSPEVSDRKSMHDSAAASASAGDYSYKLSAPVSLLSKPHLAQSAHIHGNAKPSCLRTSEIDADEKEKGGLAGDTSTVVGVQIPSPLKFLSLLNNVSKTST